jgi:hypothetical protein
VRLHRRSDDLQERHAVQIDTQLRKLITRHTCDRVFARAYGIPRHRSDDGSASQNHRGEDGMLVWRGAWDGTLSDKSFASGSARRLNVRVCRDEMALPAAILRPTSAPNTPERLKVAGLPAQRSTERRKVSNAVASTRRLSRSLL